MNILTVSKLRKEFNGEVLFDNISFDVNTKDKIAIIGKNGTGKSTLLKMIQQEISFDSGDIFINNKATIGYLSQDVIDSQQHTLEEEMLTVFKEILYYEEKLKEIALELEHSPEDDELIHRFSQIQHQYDVMGGYEYHVQIKTILTQFGFKEEEYNRPITSFSGGEKTRIAFSKLLLQNPDLLILDEPTNHLDIDIIDWLEDYLNKYNGAILIVTHDKYFISKVCRKIIEIDHQTCHIYYGTFDAYQDEKIKRYELLLKQYNRQQKEIAHLQSFIDRFKYNSKRASIAKDREKKIQRIDKIDKPHLSKQKVKLEFEGRRTTREIILRAKDVAIGYNNIPILSHINFTMRGYDKLAIIGPNGTGKTTLIKAIEEKLPVLHGRVEFIRKYRIGYFDQNQETLHYNKTIFQEIHDYHPMFTTYDVRSVAARFLFFGEDLDKPIHILSGGEKVRLVLLLLMLEKPDLLILDEPTNHLDIETKDIVEDVLSQFSGPIIFVSHDRYFINKIATKIVHLDMEKAVEFRGSYDEFKEHLEVKTEPAKKSTTTNKKQVDYTKETQKLERDIHQLEQHLEEMKAQTFLEEVYEDYSKITKLNLQIDENTKVLKELENSYFELLELIEGKEV